MARRSIPFKPHLAVLVLAGAVIGDAAAVYFVQSPMDRLTIALVLLAPIIWASARLGVVERVAHVLGGRPYQRRFVRLRTQVDQLLGEVRRLNWIAVDGERGFRDSESVAKEMDLIEAGMKQMIKHIREVAGKPTEDYVDEPGPEIEKALFR